MINDQYWINTDEFIDLDRLKSIELDTIRGICSTIPYHKIAIYGSNVLDRPNWTSVNDLMKHVYKDECSEAYNNFNVHFPNDQHTRMEAKKLFTKLTCGVYSGGINVVLRSETNYNVKNFSAHCKDTVCSLAFPLLMSFLDSLPFSEIGRAVIFLNDHELGTPIHTDGQRHPHTNDFLWLSTNLSKKFFIYDRITCTKHYVTSHSAFFNEQDWHGSDGVPEMNFSIRVDGVFTPEFKEKIGISHLTNYNV